MENEELIKKYIEKGVICLNCRKPIPISEGLKSWCCAKCNKEFLEKYNLTTKEQVTEKVFELIKIEVEK